MPIMFKCFLTRACPVRNATIDLSWFLLNLIRPSAFFLHGPLIKSLPCLWPGKLFQVVKCWHSVQFLIASLAEHFGIPRAGSGPSNGVAAPHCVYLLVGYACLAVRGNKWKVCFGSLYVTEQLFSKMRTVKSKSINWVVDERLASCH
jgi:hypothetical protein